MKKWKRSLGTSKREQGCPKRVQQCLYNILKGNKNDKFLGKNQ